MRHAQFVTLASFLVVAPLAAQRPAIAASRAMIRIGEQAVPLLEVFGSQLQDPAIEPPGHAVPPPPRSIHTFVTIRFAKENERFVAAWRQDVIGVGTAKAARTVTISTLDHAGRIVATYQLTRAWPRMIAEAAPSSAGALPVISAELEYERIVRTP